MHVLRSARMDVRLMRAATTLAEAGFAVEVIDVESELKQPEEVGQHSIQMTHLLMPGSFDSTRFERRTLIRAVRLFLSSAVRLIQTSTDIYHASEVTALPACYIAACLRQKPLIFEAYELPLSDKPITEMSRSRRWIHLFLTMLLARLLTRCSGVITVSPPIVQEIRTRYHVPRVALLRNILPYKTVEKSNRIRQHLGLAPTVRIALYQGNLQPDRSLDILVRAAPFLEQDIVIVLMGRGIGTTLAQLEALIASEGVAGRVKLLPPVPYEELLDWTSSADIGLTLYARDYTPNVQMMLPNKLFEYMMAGLPILSSSLDAIVDIIRTYDVGQIVSSLAPTDVGAAINAMLADPNALARMRRNALVASAQDFCWEQESSQLISLYREILAAQNHV